MKKVLPFVLLLLVLGCAPRLNEEKVATLGAGDGKNYTIPAISKAQTVKISAKASSGKFKILVVLEKDLGEGEKAMITGKATDKILDSKFKTDGADLQATIPANESAIVMVSADEGKAAEVKIKMTN